MQVKAITAGFLVAFANRRDSHHRWAVSIAEQLTAPLGLVVPQFSVADHRERLEELAHQYANCAPDLADLCLIRMSELHPRYPVITTDVKDFRVYRRGKRDAIPLICPPSP